MKRIYSFFAVLVASLAFAATASATPGVNGNQTSADHGGQDCQIALGWYEFPWAGHHQLEPQVDFYNCNSSVTAIEAKPGSTNVDTGVGVKGADLIGVPHTITGCDPYGFCGSGKGYYFTGNPQANCVPSTNLYIEYADYRFQENGQWRNWLSISSSPNFGSWVNSFGQNAMYECP